MKREKPPYKYWRWWLSMLFMWPLILLVIAFVILYKSLICIGEMLIEAGEWIEKFEWQAASRWLDRFGEWVFQEPQK